VQRLSHSGSVALGAAMRAALNTLGIRITDLEAKFCKSDAESTYLPKVDSNGYKSALKTFSSILLCARKNATYLK
jgi:hypothetical protein